jgi:hypothetical protein
MVKYTGYIQANKRRIICEEGITLERAIDFLAETKHGVIYDASNNKLTKEELEHVKSVRSLPRTGKDSPAASGRKVHEDTGGELFSFAGDNTGSSSKRDTEWD